MVADVKLDEYLSVFRPPTFADVRIAEVPEKRPLFEGLLYPGAWLVVGRPKIGKSWLQLQLMLCATEGTDFLGYPCTAPVHGLYIGAEDDMGRMQSRLIALGCDTPPATVAFVSQRTLISYASQFGGDYTFLQFLETYLQGNTECKVVVVDTETTCLQIWAGEASVEREARVTTSDYKQVREFDQLALKYGVVILLVNHAKKRNGDMGDPHELINRSNTAFAGASGSIVLADPPDVDPLEKSKLRILGIRGRDLKDDILLGVEQREELPHFYSRGPYQEVRQSEAEREILDAVLELMDGQDTGTYYSSHDVADVIGKRQQAVKRTFSRMSRDTAKHTYKGYRVEFRRGVGGGVRLVKRDANHE